MLKYATSPTVINFPTQLKGFLHLTSSMLCTAGNKPDAHIVEVYDGNLLKLRMQVESEEDQLEWIHAIHSVIQEVVAEEA